MKKTVTIKYIWGDSVVLKTEPETRYIISGILLRNKYTTYLLKKGEEETEHHEVEIIPYGKAFKVKGFKP